jgi:hypothetical protein
MKAYFDKLNIYIIWSGIENIRKSVRKKTRLEINIKIEKE